jgi:L-ascorbate metabolism protein UlaG (beta-lactamase superfamily)
MRTSRLIGSLGAIALAFAGCAGSAATPTVAPAATPSAASTVAATPASAQKISVAYEGNCQMEFIAPSGQRVLVDVYDHTQLTSEATANDILLTTHNHGDHLDAAFEASFPGKKITSETKDLTIGDIKIRSIAASHDENPVDAAAPSNHIFIIEMNGFKIVHGGSTGQLALTADQLAAIGDNVDIGALVLINVGGMDAKGDKANNIIKQVNPKVLIPTHVDLAAVQAAGKVWPTTYSTKKPITIVHDQLPAQTSMLLMGTMANSYGIILKAPESTW